MRLSHLLISLSFILPAGAQVTGLPHTPISAASPTLPETAEEILVGKSTDRTSTSVLLSADGQNRKLNSVPGTIGRVWAYFAVLFYADFPDPHAEIRTTESLPGIYVTLEQTPKNRLFLVHCRVNRRTQNRSVKMGQAGVFTYKGISAPDTDWTIPYDALEEKPGLWKLTPRRPLIPGEYGIFSGSAAAYMTKGNPAGELFDFAVDPKR